MNIFVFCRLKKCKEDDRMRVEQMSEKMMEPVDPFTGQTLEESQSFELTQHELNKKSFDEKKIWKQKHKEMQRLVCIFR